MSEEVIRNIIYLSVILLMPLNVFSAVKLWQLRTGKHIKALDERAAIAVILAISSVFGAIIMGLRLTNTITPGITSIAILGAAMLLAEVPAIYWLWTFRGETSNTKDC
jgi:hypothetical protein